MKIPRNISGKELVKALKIYDYAVVRQTGSHIMVTTQRNGQHHLAIPNHNPIKMGTLNGIVSRVAIHFNMSKQEAFRELFP